MRLALLSSFPSPFRCKFSGETEQARDELTGPHELLCYDYNTDPVHAFVVIVTDGDYDCATASLSFSHGENLALALFLVQLPSSSDYISAAKTRGERWPENE